MCWHELNRFELQAMRKILMLDVSEAAKYIGNVSNRTWQYWESGKNPIPADIDEEVYAMISQRNEIIDGIITHKEDEQPTRWYHAYSDFQNDYKNRTKVWWKLHQSVVAFLFSEGSKMELLVNIPLNKKSYIYQYFAQIRDKDIEHQKQMALIEKKG
jgi:hypothetical protein